MKQEYFTQEGTPYVIKTVSEKGSYNLTAGTNFDQPYVYINVPPTAFLTADLWNTLTFNTTRKVIPVQATLSCANSGFVLTVDIASCYYAMGRGDLPYTPTQVFEQLPALNKSLPLISQDWYTNNQLYGHTFRYGQAVYADSDFINPQGGLVFNFNPEAAQALIGNAETNKIQIPANGTYDVTITFTYFELQN